MSHPAHTQRFLDPLIPEAHPLGEDKVWLGCAALRLL